MHVSPMQPRYQQIWAEYCQLLIVAKRRQVKTTATNASVFADLRKLSASVKYEKCSNLY